MLENCNTVAGSSKHSQTVSEYRAQFSTFAILTSPLILGKPLRRCCVMFVCLCPAADDEVVWVSRAATMRCGLWFVRCVCHVCSLYRTKLMEWCGGCVIV